MLLLRSPTTDGTDKYESALKTTGYNPISIPVLETVLVNLENLKDVIKSGPTVLKLSAVVVTSARSCEAWREVVQQLVSSEIPVTAGTLEL